MKKEAVKRITEKIKEAGSISKLSDVCSPDDTLAHQMKQSLNTNFTKQAEAANTKPQHIP